MKAIIYVDFDETLVSENFLGEHLLELEGIENVTVDVAD